MLEAKVLPICHMAAETLSCHTAQYTDNASLSLGSSHLDLLYDCRLFLLLTFELLYSSWS